MPENFTLKPSTEEDCAISRALPLAIPLATSNKTTSSTNSFVPIKCASVPPICPAPIKEIFFFHEWSYLLFITHNYSIKN